MTPEDIRKVFPEIGDATIIIISDKSELPELSILNRSVIHKLKDWVICIAKSVVGVLTVYAVFQPQFPSYLKPAEIYVARSIDIGKQLIGNLSYPDETEEQNSYYVYDSVTKQAPRHSVPNDYFSEGITYYPHSGVPVSLQSGLVPSGQYYS